MRISRIARPGALYEASVASRNFEDVSRALSNPSVSEEVGGADVTNFEENLKRGRIPGFSGFLEKKSGDAKRVNLPREIRR